MSAFALPLALTAASGLAGALGKRPGLDNSVYEARSGAQDQAWRFLDSVYGSNWRSGLAGDSGVWDAVKHGNYSRASKFRYGKGTQGGPATPGAPAWENGDNTGAGDGNLAGGSTPFGNAPILQQVQDASGRGMAEDQNFLSQFNRESGTINRAADRFGTGRERVIRDDSARSLAAANNLTLARSASSGWGGSSMESDMLGANAAGNLRETNRSLTDAAEQATGFKVQTRQAQQRAGAGAYDAVQGRAQQYRNAPINLQLAALQSPVANPWSGAPTGQVTQPGQSPLAGGLQSALGTAGQLGGMYLARGLYGSGGDTSSYLGQGLRPGQMGQY